MVHARRAPSPPHLQLLPQVLGDVLLCDGAHDPVPVAHAHVDQHVGVAELGQLGRGVVGVEAVVAVDHAVAVVLPA